MSGPDPAAPLAFTRRARAPRGLALVAGALALIAAAAWLGAAPWLLALFALVTLPALWDVARDARFTLALDGETLAWASGRRAARLPLSMIEEAVLATTLDFSQRATLHLRDGRRLRIPPECLPPGRALDAALEARGIPHRRSLFSF